MNTKKQKQEDNTGTDKNEYYDILTTEEALVEMSKISDQIGDVVDNPIESNDK